MNVLDNCSENNGEFLNFLQKAFRDNSESTVSDFVEKIQEYLRDKKIVNTKNNVVVDLDILGRIIEETRFSDAEVIVSKDAVKLRVHRVGMPFVFSKTEKRTINEEILDFLQKHTPCWRFPRADKETPIDTDVWCFENGWKKRKFAGAIGKYLYVWPRNCSSKNPDVPYRYVRVVLPDPDNPHEQPPNNAGFM